MWRREMTTELIRVVGSGGVELRQLRLSLYTYPLGCAVFNTCALASCMSVSREEQRACI